MKRSSGILLPLFSLPGDYGLGTIGADARKFVDFLERTNQRIWQVLPLGHTRNGSPYDLISAFAGGYHFIDLEDLVEQGLLTQEDIAPLAYEADGTIPYDAILKNRKEVLRKAYGNRTEAMKQEQKVFEEKNQYWLEDYALYNALNDYFGTATWRDWKVELQKREKEPMEYYREMLGKEIDQYVFFQYLFYRQWEALKEYAAKRDVSIIGDIPIYVAIDSVDVWAHPQLFQLDSELVPTAVSGCPPDPYCEEGQYWGHALYNWEAHKKEGYQWWIQRIKQSCEIYRMVRLDHFIGFQRYWEIPYETRDARLGRWMQGPGSDFFRGLFAEVAPQCIIVEDLGEIGDDIASLRDEFDLMGMKVLSFAFDCNVPFNYCPHTYRKNCVVYTSMHDLNPVLGWMNQATPEDQAYATAYLNLTKEEGIAWGFLRGAWSSVGDLAIAQMQDILELDERSRTNVPPFLEGNWQWRFTWDMLSEEAKQKLKRMTDLCERFESKKHV